MTVQVLAVVGNPKTGSRTREVAEAVAARLADTTSAVADISIDTMELAPLGPDLLGWGSPEAGAAVARLLEADVLVVASPVYKATYTGLLKLLFDQVGAGALGGRVAIPLMVGAGPHHAMAVDSHLRPLLVEVGASCPTAGLYVIDSTLDTFDAQLDPWAAQWSEIAVAAAMARVHDTVAG